MRTACLPTISASVATRCQHLEGQSSSEQIWTGIQSLPPAWVRARGSPVQWGPISGEVRDGAGEGHESKQFSSWPIWNPDHSLPKNYIKCEIILLDCFKNKWEEGTILSIDNKL